MVKFIKLGCFMVLARSGIRFAICFLGRFPNAADGRPGTSVGSLAWPVVM